MQSLIPTSFLLLSFLAWESCSTFEPDFASDRFTIGKTSRQQVEAYFGEPTGIDTSSIGGATTLRYAYRYGDPNPRPPEQRRGVWQVPQKNLVIEFVNDTLHGYLYNNSVDHSSTNFKRELRWKVPIGSADKAAVMSVLGEPAGKITLPTSLFGHSLLKHLEHVVPLNASETWCYCYDYIYFRANSRKRFEYYKFLAVYFNSAGIVIDKFYGESDKTEPRITRMYTN